MDVVTGNPLSGEASCLSVGSVPPSISTAGKGNSVFDDEFRKEATPFENLNELCFTELAAKAATVEELVAGSGGSVAEVSCASSTCSVSGNLSDGVSSHSLRNGTPGLSEQINAKLLKRTISRHGRSSQRWAADPLSHLAVRLTTGCVPIVKGGNVLFVSASSKPSWIFPKGGWENDERIEESALRECFEEAGVIGVLGPKLSEVQYETRKARKRRLETEEMLKLKRQHSETPSTPREVVVGINNAPTIDSNNVTAIELPSDTNTCVSNATAPEVVIDTSALKGTPTAAAAINAAHVSDEAFAKIRGMKKGKRQFDETSSIQSDASSYSQVRMCLFPLYVTSVKSEWPESGRLRRAVPIDEAITILESRPELQAALKEVKEKGLHLLDGEGVSLNESKPTAIPASLPKVADLR